MDLSQGYWRSRQGVTNFTELPTSPDGTDWGIYGDTAVEQWAGVMLEASMENLLRAVDSLPRELENQVITGDDEWGSR